MVDGLLILVKNCQCGVGWRVVVCSKNTLMRLEACFLGLMTFFEP